MLSKIDPKRIIKKENYYLYFMRNQDIKNLKEKIYKFSPVCPILKKKYSINKMVIDHEHKLKSEEPDNKKGAVRGMIEFRANAMLGKIENMWKRYGFHKEEDLSLSDVLRAMADYLEKEHYHENYKNSKLYFIHPNEVPKRKKITKRDQNLIQKWYLKVYPNKRKIPKYVYYNNEVNKILNDIKNFKQNKKVSKKQK